VAVWLHTFIHDLNAALRHGATTQTKEPSHDRVSYDTIAHFAEAREVDKKSFLKEGWDGAVQIGGLCEYPQFVHDEGSIRSGPEKIGHQPEARGDLLFKGFLGSFF
jgi:hypothetical protein